MTDGPTNGKDLARPGNAARPLSPPQPKRRGNTHCLAIAGAIGALLLGTNALAQTSVAQIRAHCAQVKNSEASGDDNLYPAQFPTLWRCMRGSVYVCEIGASGRGCAKAGHSTAPTPGVLTWCRENPGSDFVPGAYLAGAAITWRCRGTTPVIIATEAVDEQGYVKRFWRKVGP